MYRTYDTGTTMMCCRMLYSRARQMAAAQNINSRLDMKRC